MMKKFLLFIILTFSFLGYAQNVGDFQTRPTGVTWPQNWNSAVWQVFTSTGWQDTASYPGQTSGNYTVTILGGDVIDIPTSPPALFQITIGNLYVKGTLNITKDFTINTFVPGPAPYVFIQNGLINMYKNVNFRLPVGSNIFIDISNAATQGIQEVNGCTGNTRIYIGSNIFTACQGTTADPFPAINNAAADASILADASPSTICLGASVNLIGDKQGAAAVTDIKWTLINRPSGPVSELLGENPTVPYTYTVSPSILDAAGDYVFRFSFMLGSALKTKTVNVRVNGPTFTTTPTALSTYCLNAVPTTPLSVVASGAGTLTYQWCRNTVNSNFGGIPISGATSSSYTPPTNAVGTTYYYIIVTAACGVARSNTAQVVVNPSTASVINHPVSTNYCQNAVATELAVSGTGVTGYQWYRSSTATGPGTVISGATAATYTPNTSAIGTVYYYALLQGTCGGTFSNRATITVGATPTAAVAAAIAGPLCSGSAVVFNLTGTTGSTVTYKINGGADQSVVLTGGSATVTVPSTTANQTLNIVSVANGVCIAPLSSSATVLVGQTTVYNGAWSNGVPNSNGLNAVFETSYNTSAGDISACNCEVKSGAVLTVSQGKYVEIQDNIVNNGQIVIESDGNLIQRNDTGTYTGTGTFILKRNSQMKRLDYTYWGTPVDNQQLKAFSPLTVASRFYSYNEQDDSFSTIPNISGTSMVPGKGYVIRAPDNFSPTSTQTFVGTYAQAGTFTARPNNGIIPVGVTKAGAGKNLLGNPYPSNMELNKLKADNSLLTGTFYFWTNYATWTSNTGGVGTVGNYNGNGYAAWNGTGGVQATSAAGSLAGPVPTNIIKPGQGFLAEVNNAGTVQFKNGIRTRAGATAPFFNRIISSTEKTDLDSRYWLALTTPIATTNTILIGYVSGASNDYDPGFDAIYPSESNDEFYSKAVGRKLLIQGRQSPFASSDIVQLGVKHFARGNYTIALVNKDGNFDEGQQIYLKDKLTGIISNLQQGSYEYYSEAGTTDNRFEIIYELAAMSKGVSMKGVLNIYLDAGNFVVSSSGDSIKSAEVYDSVGRLILTIQGNNTGELRFTSDILIKGIYFLKTELKGGSTHTTKIRK